MTDQSWMRVVGVSRRFGEVVAVDHIDLEIEQGEFVCILGPSGCGKTTLLRIVAGLEHQDEGQVWLRGRQLGAVPPEGRRLGMVFQSYALFPHLTVFDNVAFPLRAGQWLGRRSRPGELVDRVLGALRMVHLDGFEDRYPSEISGGQAQRVALARAIAPDPDVVLLDEPLSALDLKVRQRMREELKSLQQILGTTFVHVTHDQDEALVLASRIALMRDGRIEQLGRPSDLYQRPATRFAAEFIGDQSFIRGQSEGRNGERLRVRWRDRHLEPLDHANGRVGPVDVMLRPEQIQPFRGTGIPIDTMVRTVDFRGATVDVELLIGEDSARMSCDASELSGALTSSNLKVTIDDRAGIAYPAEEAAP